MPDWVPKSKNWEKDILKVDTIMRDPDTGSLMAYLHWNNGKKSRVSIEQCYEKCPMKVSLLHQFANGRCALETNSPPDAPVL